MNNKRGITLLELLVTISLISISATVVLSAINSAEQRKKIRDVERLSDISIIFGAVETFWVDMKRLPGEADMTYTSKEQENEFWQEIEKYLPTQLADPTNEGTFVYRYRHEGTFYELDCMVESEGGLIEARSDGGSDDTRFEVGADLSIL